MWRATALQMTHSQSIDFHGVAADFAHQCGVLSTKPTDTRQVQRVHTSALVAGVVSALSREEWPRPAHDTEIHGVSDSLQGPSTDDAMDDTIHDDTAARYATAGAWMSLQSTYRDLRDVRGNLSFN